VPPVCVKHRSRARRATQGDQKAQGQNRTHRFFSNRRRSACLRKAQAAPSQQIAASRLVTSLASRDLRCITASLTPRDAVPDRRIAAAPPSSVMSFRRFMCPPRAQFCSSLALCRPPASEEWARAWHQRVRGSMVAVGTRISPRPPHRSRRALLTHRAPPSGQTLCDERVTFDARRAAIFRIDAVIRLTVRTAAA
jgi:hypothetical protein